MAFPQEHPLPWGFAGSSGTIIDAQSGAPIRGAVLVARWNWLRYYPGGFHSSPRYYDEGEVLHIAEAVSDDEGRYALAPWGPVVRGMGQVENDSPSVTAFKRGYEPFQKSLGADRSGVIRMRQQSASDEELAKSIAAVQQGIYEAGDIHGLHWTYPNDFWKSMPRMILALNREKRRLGEAGYAVLGAHLLNGRSGKGDLSLPGYDERMNNSKGIPPTPAIAAITWQIRRDDGSAVRRVVEQKRVGSSSYVGFWISPWRHPQPAPPGWSIDVDAVPLVRFYAAGYRGQPDMPWTEAGGTVALAPVPATHEGWLGELRRWLRDLDEALARGDRTQAIEEQRPLIWVLAEECKRLTLDARKGICFDPTSDIGRLGGIPEAMQWYVAENEFGRGDGRKPSHTAPASHIQGISARRAPNPGDPKPVGGFTIGPTPEPRKDPPR
ncbi:MAG: hypothetical protein ABI789_00220 [Usitatibacter sp.]